jgi:hypothetical protein
MLYRRWRFVRDNWYAICLVEGAKRKTNMAANRRRSDASFDPMPRTTSDEDIKKAQAIREALRKLLPDQCETGADGYWAISAD